MQTTAVFKAGVTLQIKFTTNDGAAVLLDNSVHCPKSPAALCPKLKPGMDFLVTRFRTGEEFFQSICASGYMHERHTP